MATTPNQLVEQATRHAAHLERLKSGEVKKFAAYLKRMERGIRTELAGGELTEFTTARLERLLQSVRGVMRVEMDQFRREWRRMVTDLAEYEAGFEARSLGQVVAYNFTLPSADQLAVAVFSNPLQVAGLDGGSLLDEFYDGWSDREIRRVSNTIRRGFAQGQTTGQVIRAIRGSAPMRYTDGALALTDRAMATMVRTALQHAAVQAREQTWNRNADIVRGVRWVSTLDSRTSVQCRTLDGEVFPVGSGPRPPAHPGCRSSTVASLDERFAILEKGGTRRARDPKTGEVTTAKADTTYYGWLKRQPAKVQDSIIGPARGKLLRNGGLTADRFAELQLGRNFEPLTLAEMRALEPAAFEKAGL